MWLTESPELSLLIQNKGTSLLSLKISAPDYVHLETNTVHLQQNEDKKVKVSIGKESKDTFIVLTAKDRNCSINFKDLIPHNSGKKTDHTAKSAFVDIVTKVPSIVFLSIAAVILVASSWMCVKFRSKHLTGEGTKYQKLETELPVTSAGKKETDVTGKKETDVVDGWDDSWGDDSWGDSWDDEEAPRTPSMPITPSLSSKGLASRRLSKDAWKD
ncbi:hypothetical protein IFM89_034899 [Coptis chinensis]|uniref:DUF7356 domain-containing protein n=1 Tax=Coptis chinensis TaxID=261450 RepID=A0A835I5M9_9MAGN|nr:hypothetical protein IFM89_034899 [Coptis chinensis]